jgi:hypothetical protein
MQRLDDRQGNRFTSPLVQRPAERINAIPVFRNPLDGRLSGRAIDLVPHWYNAWPHRSTALRLLMLQRMVGWTIARKWSNAASRARAGRRRGANRAPGRSRQRFGG